MKANFEAWGADYEEAYINAVPVFCQFFGGQDWKIASWEAWPAYEKVGKDAGVKLWRVEFVAVSTL